MCLCVDRIINKFKGKVESCFLVIILCLVMIYSPPRDV